MLIFLSLTGLKGYAQTTTANSITIENYYKLKWGHADEFIALWKKKSLSAFKKVAGKKAMF